MRRRSPIENAILRRFQKDVRMLETKSLYIFRRFQDVVNSDAMRIVNEEIKTRKNSDAEIVHVIETHLSQSQKDN